MTPVSRPRHPLAMARGAQVTYQLTPAGRELMASLQPLVHWGLRWHGQQDQQRGAS